MHCASFAAVDHNRGEGGRGKSSNSRGLRDMLKEEAESIVAGQADIG